MRGVLVMLAATALITASGCGGARYEHRLEETLDNWRYKKRLDDNLIAAPKGTKFESYHIFVRPPQSLKGPSKEFLLGVQEPGKFELTESFLEGNKQSLHVLARVKAPKDPASKKKAAAKPEDAVVRGEFSADVIAILNSVYGVELDLAKAKEESKGQKIKNSYKHLFFEANGKDVHVYLYGKKDAIYNVALIFEYPKSESKTLASKIELCLESFTTGTRAQKAYSGAVTEDEQNEPQPGAPVAF